jgi:hypothetical protein
MRSTSPLRRERELKRSILLVSVLLLSITIIAFTRSQNGQDDAEVDEPSIPELAAATAPIVTHMPPDSATGEHEPTLEPEATSEPEPTPSPERIEVVSVEYVSHLTGPESPTHTELEGWNIAGTDLGFTFEHEDTLYMVFGDTWGRDGVEGTDWRSNIMVIVESHPEYGYVITDAITDENGEAKELLPSLKVPKEEYTVIPNTGIAVGDRMYLHYMSVRDWVQHPSKYKEPIVNGSGIAWSDDGGHTWVQDPDAVWLGPSDFSESTMVRHDGYIYVFGTPPGRLGPAKLFRVPEDDLLDPTQYEYWTDDGWSPDAELAIEVVPAPVGERSIRWSERHQRWLMMYKNEETHHIVLRTAENLEGPWDEERNIVSPGEYPRLYAPLMLPVEGDEVYFAMSIFLPEYQVYLMRVTLN